MNFFYVITIISLALVSAIADERDISLITKMEGRRLEPGQQKRIHHDGECFIIQSTGASVAFVPDKNISEVSTITNSGSNSTFTKSPCVLTASYGKTLSKSEDILNNPTSIVSGDFLVIKVAGLTQNARACNRRMWGQASGRTSEPADECIASNVASNSARISDMASQNGRPLWTYNPKRSEWTLTKEAGVTGLRFGGSLDYVFYDPTMGVGLQMGTNAVSLNVQLTTESVTASSSTGTGGSGDGGGEDAGGFDGGDPDAPSACTPTTAGTSPDGIDNDCDGTIDEATTVAGGGSCNDRGSTIIGGASRTYGSPYTCPTSTNLGSCAGKSGKSFSHVTFHHWTTKFRYYYTADCSGTSGPAGHIPSCAGGSGLQVNDIRIYSRTGTVPNSWSTYSARTGPGGETQMSDIAASSGQCITLTYNEYNCTYNSYKVSTSADYGYVTCNYITNSTVYN